jgi:hypothetical protein
MGTFEKWAARFLLLLQPVLFHGRTLVFPTTHIPYDIEGYHYPLIAHMAAMLRRGWLPFCNPNTYAGMPLSADLQAQMWYPPVWAAIALGNIGAGRHLFYWVEWLVPLHMALAGVGAFALFRRMGLVRPAAFLGASVCQLGGFYASQACHLGAVCSAAWLPLGALAVWELRAGFRARWFAVLAAAVAASILAGFAATTIVVCGALLLFAVGLAVTGEARWRTVALLFAAVGVAAVAAAVELIPLVELTSLSIASLRWRWQSPMGAPLETLVSLVWPNYFHIFEPDSGYRLPYNYTFLYAYCGLAPILLAGAALFLRGCRRAAMFLVLAVLGAFWMLGEFTPVYPAVFGLLPKLVRSASYAWLAMAAFCFFVGATAAVVLDHLGRRAAPAVLWIVALATSADLILTGGNRPMNAAHGGYQSITATEFDYQRDAAALRALQGMVRTSNPPLRTDYADVWAPGILAGGMLGMPTSDGHVPFMLRRMMLLRRLFTDGKPEDRNRPVSRLDSPLLRMLNVGYIGTLFEIPQERSAAAGLSRAGSHAGLTMYRVPRPLPRFWMVPSVRYSAGETETFQILARPDFDPEREAVVESKFKATSGMSVGAVRVLEYRPDEIRLHVESAGAGFLATSEPMYPGWEATCNGAVTAIVMTNGVFRGISIPPGSSEILMTYHPHRLGVSALLSVLAWAGLAACIVFPRTGGSAILLESRPFR